jgi:hypothetical protein
MGGYQIGCDDTYLTKKVNKINSITLILEERNVKTEINSLIKYLCFKIKEIEGKILFTTKFINNKLDLKKISLAKNNNIFVRQFMWEKNTKKLKTLIEKKEVE